MQEPVLLEVETRILKYSFTVVSNFFICCMILNGIKQHCKQHLSIQALGIPLFGEYGVKSMSETYLELCFHKWKGNDVLHIGVI